MSYAQIFKSVSGVRCKVWFLDRGLEILKIPAILIRTDAYELFEDSTEGLNIFVANLITDFIDLHRRI
jgi:hypothetical protein